MNGGAAASISEDAAPPGQPETVILIVKPYGRSCVEPNLRAGSGASSVATTISTRRSAWRNSPRPIPNSSSRDGFRSSTGSRRSRAGAGSRRGSNGRFATSSATRPGEFWRRISVLAQAKKRSGDSSAGGGGKSIPTANGRRSRAGAGSRCAAPLIVSERQRGVLPKAGPGISPRPASRIPPIPANRRPDAQYRTPRRRTPWPL